MIESIFAPLTSRDFADAIKDFDLSYAENIEAVSLELNYHKYDSVTLRSLAYNTTNAGEQCLLLGDPNSILSVITNSNLSPHIVLLLIRRINAVRPRPLVPSDNLMRSYVLTTYRVLEYLMRNRVVVNDVVLFQQVWDAAVRFECSTEVFESIASFYLVKRLGLGQHSDKALETMLFILGRISNPDSKLMTPELTTKLGFALEDYEDAIRAWASKKIPDCNGLPLTWILKVVDLYF